ncbi:MAG: zinc-ribbon domain-containing protein [Eubacterium sp.]|nr:zinc-ribbon domain-containing protein [Eubacterium sp.]
MKKCEKCGNMIQDNSVFCEYCGEEQKDVLSDDKMVPDSDKKKKIIIISLFCAVLIAGIIIAVLLISKKDSSGKTDKSKNDASDKNEAVIPDEVDEQEVDDPDETDEQEADVPDEIDKYGAVVLDEINKYGELSFEDTDMYSDSKGVCYLNLIDLDQDGTDELITAHYDENNNAYLGYELEIWTCQNGESKCIYSGDAFANGPENVDIRFIETNGKKCMILREGASHVFDLYCIENGEWTLYDTVNEYDELEFESDENYLLKGERCPVIVYEMLNNFGDDTKIESWKSGLEQNYNNVCTQLGITNDQIKAEEQEEQEEPEEPQVEEGDYAYEVGGHTFYLRTNIDDYISNGEVDLISMCDSLGYTHKWEQANIHWENQDDYTSGVFEPTIAFIARYDWLVITLNNNTVEVKDNPSGGDSYMTNGRNVKVSILPSEYKGTTSRTDKIAYMVSSDAAEYGDILVKTNGESDGAGKFLVSKDQIILFVASMEYYQNQIDGNLFEDCGYNVDNDLGELVQYSY